MKAAHIQQTGPPENIHYGELPTPAATGSQVLVRVEAVSLNPVDTYIRSGAIAMELPMPFVVGCDLAGVVEETGADANRFQAGQRVWGSNQGLLGRQGRYSTMTVALGQWSLRVSERPPFRVCGAPQLTTCGLWVLRPYCISTEVAGRM